jgi:SAM-dependent methyltransferase
MRLNWHTYRYYPYEIDLARREVASLLQAGVSKEVDGGVELKEYVNAGSARHLTYFASYVDGHGQVETVQSRLESAGRAGKNRQATRYSVHGLHEYKGKFNPQVAKAILNIFGIHRSNRVLDPFCGSGTTLVECAHMGAASCGTDINPFAVYLANAKLLALATPAEALATTLRTLAIRFRQTKRWTSRISDSPRNAYLQAWFDPNTLQVIELVKQNIEDVAGNTAPVFLALASNILREYSLQDPNDLRIRRRKSPLPTAPLVEVFIATAQQFIERLESTQSILGVTKNAGRAMLFDITELTGQEFSHSFNAAITSPPYAMALPYIDTQRLSLVWLDILPADRILVLESELIGSREFRGQQKKQMINDMGNNAASLPKSEVKFCRKLQDSLTVTDGFRRQAVPSLLYRYFAAMQASFRAVQRVMNRNAPFALIVGHNHTVLGGRRFDINTPAHLASIAEQVGWTVEELIEMQTYQRYGYHMSNAVAAETLLILRSQ